VLADLPSTDEPVLLEEFDGRTEEKTRLSLPSGGHLRDCLDQTAAGGCDVRECAFEPCAGNSLAAVMLVDEDARDPPAGRRWRGLRVFTLVLQSELLRRPVLAPALR
jgi:hypothetical protein